MALIVKHVVAFLALLESILREEGIARVSRLSHQGNDIPLTLAYAAMCFTCSSFTALSTRFFSTKEPIGDVAIASLTHSALLVHCKHADEIDDKNCVAFGIGLVDMLDVRIDASNGNVIEDDYAVRTQWSPLPSSASILLCSMAFFKKASESSSPSAF